MTRPNGVREDTKIVLGCDDVRGGYHEFPDPNARHAGDVSRVKRIITFSCLQPGILFGILSCDAMYGHRMLGAELGPRVPGS